MILLCGPYASGKTHFYNCFLKELGYHHFNPSTDEKMASKIVSVQKLLEGGKSVVIDSTNHLVCYY